MAAHLNESICVCIAAYNAESTIARAVSSALAQPRVSEVIVVDDASTDLTAATARQGDDGSGRLTIIVLDKNGGPSAARNRALSISTADIFCVLDADDYFIPGRIDRLLAIDSGQWDCLADDILIVPEQAPSNHTIGPLTEAPVPIVELTAPTFILGNVSTPRKPRAELGFLKPLMRRHFLVANNLTYDTRLRLGEDYALYVRVLLAGARFKVVGFCGYVAVERASSLSSLHRASDLAGIAAFDAETAETEGISAEAKHALTIHRRATQKKWALAQALEVRREQGLGPALTFLAGQLRNAPYITSEILHARLERLRHHLGGEKSALKPRWLIGERAIQSG
jgi:succinoglycan biosynthesis protein ExoU